MVKFLLRLPDRLHDALKESAQREHRSLHGEILHALELYLSRAQKEKSKSRDKDEKRNV